MTNNSGTTNFGPSNPQKATHCIFDLDGLLINTEPLYEQAIQEVLDTFGKTYTLEVKLAIMGRQARAVAEGLVAAYKLPITWEEMAKLQEEAEKKILRENSLMPGASRLVSHLYAHRVPLALATSSNESMFKLKTEKHQSIFKQFHHIVCGGSDAMVKNGKPAPDIFRVAASRFPDKPDPAKCLVFEDSPNGIRAARAAGMQCVMVPDAIIPTEMWQDATIVIESLEDFRPELFSLPVLTANPEPDTE